MSVAPIVMFVYNRADHFKQTYEALSKCIGAEESVLYIFSDGAKTEKDISKVNEVRMTLKDVAKEARFQKVHIVESETNRGLAASVIAGVTQVLAEYGRLIVVEDDCMPSPYFLSFMNLCLQEYEEKRKVGAIAGFAPPISFPESFHEDVYFAYRSCSWGWATWKDRWDGVDWELKEVSDFYKNPALIQKLNANGMDRFIRLHRQTQGNGSSWSVRFGAHLVKNDQLTVYPRYSYIQNIGCDASGVHSQAKDAEKMRVDLSKVIESPRLTEPSVNPEIQRIMKKHYSAGIVSDIKRTIATVAIVLKERWKMKVD